MSDITPNAGAKKKFQLKMPHAFVLLFTIAIIAALLTYIIPAGSYDRVDFNGRMIVDPTSYHAVDQTPATLFQVLKAFPKGLEQAASIVFFIFIVGGSFYVVQKTGAIDAGIAALVRKTAGKGILVIPLISIIFSFGGGVYGMFEETLPFIPALVLLSVSLGFDSLTGAALALAATTAGFTGAFLNPFTIGVAQGIAELPLFSGLGFRLVVFGVITAITIAYMIWYALRVQKNPALSPMYEIDKQREIKLDFDNTVFTGLHKLSLLVVLATFGILVYGVLTYGWYIQEISGLFFGMAMAIGIINRRGFNNIAEDFIEGCAMLAYGALIVGMARAILVILTDSNIIDTIIAGMAASIQGLPNVITALGIYFVQIIISFIVPSGSGMASLTMPVLAPLSDLVGVTRQTAVLAYQFADGFTNIITPLSGPMLAGLALARIPFQKWLRYIMPLAVIWWIAGAIFVVIAGMTNYGPF